MANTVRILRSTTAGNTPASLVSGQIAINESDGKLFYRNGSGAVTALPTGSPLFSYATTASFPATGTSGLYLASDTSKIYRWESTVYVEVGSVATGVSDGSKGDITVSGSGGTWTIAAGAVVTADIADGAVTIAKTTGLQKSITSGTAIPTGGSSGDIYLRYT